MAAKKRVGFFSFTCCEGCIISFIELLNTKFDEYLRKMQIENFKALKTEKRIKKLDIAFIEGAISTEDEIERLKEIRKKTKFLIAFGSGACNGFPSNQRNNFDKEKNKKIRELIKKFHQNKTIEPVKTYVKVDGEIPGCPVDEKLLEEKIEGYLR